MSLSDFEGALQMVSRRCHVFRLARGEKARFIDADWARGGATCDPLEAFDKFNEGGPYNVGVRGTGLVIVDIDRPVNGHKHDGRETLERMGLELPPTFTVRTPSGGEHRYYDAGDLTFSQRGLGPGVDVRTSGGYVLGPGSVIDGVPYEILDDRAFFPVSQALASLLTAVKPKEWRGDAVPAIGGLDSTGAITRAYDFLREALPAIEGRGGDAHTLSVANRLLDFGCSAEAALELMCEHWNSRCDPPWDFEDLQRKVENAAAYRKSPIGIANAGAGFEPVPAPKLEAQSEFRRRLVPLGLTMAEAAKVPRRPWLIPGVLLRRACSMLIAPGGTGKSALSINVAVALAMGDDGRLGFEVREQTRVLIVNAEDDRQEMNNRLTALGKLYGFEGSDYEGQIVTYDRHTGGARPFRVVQQGKKGLETTEDVGELVAFARENGFGAIIVDPLVKSHCADENKNADMDFVLSVFSDMAHAANAAVLLVHHTRKPPDADASGFAGNADAGRGASAIKDACRIAKTLFTMTAKEAASLGVPPSERFAYARLDDAKSNYSARGASERWFRLNSVTLPNGDDAPAMKPAEFESASVGSERRGRIVALLAAAEQGGRGLACTYYGKDNAASVLAAELGLDRETLKADLEALEATGAIRRKADGQTDRWAVTDEGREWFPN